MLVAVVFIFASGAKADGPAASATQNPAMGDPDKPVVLPEFHVSDIRQRLKKREEERKETGRDFLCIQNAELIDSLVFCREYKKAHPDEQVRTVVWQTHENLGLDGIGSIAVPSRLNAMAAYTLNGRIWMHHTLWGDTTSYLRARDIFTTPVRDFVEKFREEIPKHATGGSSVFHLSPDAADIPPGLPYDDDNLQVLCAEHKLRDLGVAVKVQPATERVVTKDSNLMLIFGGLGLNYFVYRPRYGCYQLTNEYVEECDFSATPADP